MTDVNWGETVGVLGLCALQFLFFAGLIGLALGIAYYQRRAQRQAWGELAARTGLTLEANGWFTPLRVTGTYRGHALTLDTFTRGSGKSRTTYTRLIVFVNNQANVYLALYQESVFSKMGKFFGMEDVQTGDEEVDRRFIVKSRPESFARSVFTSIGLREKLLQARVLNVEVDGRELTFEQAGLLTEAEYLKFLLDLFCELAERVERAS
jgi:hypothetical protein